MGISNFIPTGRVIGATACGRKAGEPISEGVSPVAGTDTSTPLAAMNSCAKMNQDVHSGGTLLNMRLSHDLVKTKRGRSNLAAMVQTFFDMGAFHVQFNTLSTETLLEAQKHPEIIPDLKKLMNYYLPMTVKLLDAYEEMDQQPVQGENIQASKKEIEDTLDTLNQAFEKLLDSVFQDTAWDVSSDISVLHTLLAQEGLTDDDFAKMKKN